LWAKYGPVVSLSKATMPGEMVAGGGFMVMPLFIEMNAVSGDRTRRASVV
jgi:hypothetical protein